MSDVETLSASSASRFVEVEAVLLDDDHLSERMWMLTITRPDKVSDDRVGFWLCAAEGKLRSNFVHLKWRFPLLRSDDDTFTIPPLQPHFPSVDGSTFHQVENHRPPMHGQMKIPGTKIAASDAQRLASLLSVPF
jgi:hypothetical protein